MNNKNSLVTLLAIVVLIGVGVYVYATNQNRENNRDVDTGVVHTEVVKTEIGEVEIELDRPLSQSFSNAVSNTETTPTQTTETNSTKKYFAQNTIQNVVEAVVRPFTLGFYYFDTINDNGIEKCSAQNRNDIDEKDLPNYDAENFTLTDIEFKDRSVYLHVEADEVPEKICAQIIQFQEFKNSIYDAIHVIVK